MSKPERPYIQSCPVGCQSHLENSDIILPEGPLRRCPSCGQLTSPCSEERYLESMKEFDDPKGTWPTGDSAKRLLRHTKQIVGNIERYLDKRAIEIRLLDVGCSSGAFVAAARSLSIEAEGVEPASAPAKTALEAGLKVYQGLLEEVNLPSASYDVVTLFEVLEHVKDPMSLLKECRRILREGGLLVIRTGNTDSWSAHYQKERWEYFSIEKHGGHISFFNPASVGRLAERSGFLIETLKTHRVSFHNKGEVSFLIYRSLKILAEVLNTPSIWFGKGEELVVFQRKQ